MMKTKTNKIILILGLFFLLSANIIITSNKIEAASIRNAGSIKIGEKVSVNGIQYDKNTGDIYNAYKISIPDYGYIKISGSPLNPYLFKSIPTNSTAPLTQAPIYTIRSNDLNTAYIAVSKGTYYIIFGSYLENKINLKTSFIKCNLENNYCRAKAKKIASGKKISVCISDGYEYDRWYKIILNKNKTITITSYLINGAEEKNFVIYDGNGKIISCPALGNNTYRTAILSKGTYYLRVKHGYNYADNIFPGIIKIISWK